MNICMFTNTYLPQVSGVARSVHMFAEDLRHMGHHVLVIGPQYAGAKTVEEGVLRLPALQKFNGSDFSVRIPLPFMVMRAINEFQPHIIHSHHPFLLGDTALRVARRKRLPLVFTYHTQYEQYTHYVALEGETVQHFVMQLAALYTDFCTRVVVPVKSIAEVLRARGVERPIEEIPTGVDTAFFAGGDGAAFRRRHGLPPTAAVLGHLGRLGAEKNLAYLAQAVSDYLLRHPQAFFLVVGKGDQQEHLARIFEAAGVGQRLLLVGELTGTELRDAYKAMDLFVFASKTETQGIVLIEAMAAGKPVIALDASGTREVVTDGVNGRLLPEDASPLEYAAAIEGFFSSSRRRKRWAAAAEKTAQRYSREASARKMAALYESALAERLNTQSWMAAEQGPLELMLQRIRTEWELLSQKSAAAAGAINAELNKSHSLPQPEKDHFNSSPPIK